MNRTTAQERLGRLLAIVPWVAAHDGPDVDEVCRRFGIAEKELLADLDLLFLCGVHPFTPDTLIEVDVADGRVWIRFADYFRAPLRLTPPEGLALVGAGAGLLAVPGADPDGALARALAKVETVLGVGAGESFDVELGAVRQTVLDAVRQGTDQHRMVEISYYSFGRDGHSQRVVHPWRVFNHAGQWYVDGWCELAAAERLFRVDRMSSAVLTDRRFATQMATGPGDRVFAPDAGDPMTVLDLDPPAHWIAEQYPNEGVEQQPGGRLRVRLRSGQQAWLERLLLRAGPHATVVEGDTRLRAGAAARVLERYREP
ncbi:MAG: WYL domain-containing protein [Actinomycetota bacterium]|nr:WYL domain-containing protein [Actinomycetota bacterium]